MELGVKIIYRSDVQKIMYKYMYDQNGFVIFQFYSQPKTVGYGKSDDENEKTY